MLEIQGLPDEIMLSVTPNDFLQVGQDTQEVKTLKSLPNEILLKIFTNLSTFDLLVNVARVSQRFHDLAMSPGKYSN